MLDVSLRAGALPSYFYCLGGCFTTFCLEILDNFGVVVPVYWFRCWVVYRFDGFEFVSSRVILVCVGSPTTSLLVLCNHFNNLCLVKFVPDVLLYFNKIRAKTRLKRNNNYTVRF